MTLELHAATDTCNTSLGNNNSSILLKACGFVIMTITEALVDYLLLFDVFIRFYCVLKIKMFVFKLSVPLILHFKSVKGNFTCLSVSKRNIFPLYFIGKCTFFYF